MIKGWYKIGEKRFFSKVQALEAAKNDASKISYEWQNQIWDQIDFSTEPLESWHELLRQRCMELRAKYDWLQVFYSGGWDSTTVLDAFVTNRIPVDEIIIFDRKYLSDPEIPAAIEHARQIKKFHFPNVVLTVLDVEYDFSRHFFNDLQDQWIYSPGNNMKFTRWPDRMNVFKYSSQYMKDADLRRGRVGLVEGKDKPRVLLRDNNWYTFFVDSNTIDTNLSPVDDFFYSENIPELHIKQVHMSIRWFESWSNLDRNLEEFVHQVQSHQTGPLIYQDYNIGIGRTCIANDHARGGLMKAWNSNNATAYQSSKILSHEKQVDAVSLTIYQNGLNEIKKITGVDLLLGGRLPDFITKQRWVKQYNKESS